ncbi:alpha-2-macroglobulin receptor-associated protein [Athalia rosae]|uniref:alpha-2-macroglobulin receptor-associated protein n=1 Tax=Athalia rosae TaxID=37344 RepID=UPI0020336B8A|nr:alpha-2-macroglobulin receptor-associated protein [Athalia rosae]
MLSTTMDVKKWNHILILILPVLLSLSSCESFNHGFNKYSAAVNAPTEGASILPPSSLRDLDKPFRMAKLNLLWSKAKHRLTHTKLQSLFSDLKIHDKEEIAFKHAKSNGEDPEGLQEAVMRKRLIGIMSTYDLLEHFANTEDPSLLKHYKALNDGSNYVSQDVFENRKLNQLWAKAEVAGFSDEELSALKEEFMHHQEKVDEYMSLLSDVEGGDNKRHENSLNDKHESWNMIENEEEQNNIPGTNIDYLTKANLIREKHVQLRDGYDHLERLTAQGPHHKEFVESKVQGLWRIAQQAKFTPNELASLKEELHHYERRLLKLRHLHAATALAEAKKNNKQDYDNSTADKSIKKHARTVEKLHLELEAKIMQKHVEL